MNSEGVQTASGRLAPPSLDTLHGLDLRPSMSPLGIHIAANPPGRIRGTEMDRAVFIDRDGTISRDVPYCSRPEDMEILSGAGEGLSLLNARGFKVVVITNQSGIARGYFTAEMLAKIHERMIAELARSGARVDAIYYCPHHPDEGCGCRKPHPNLLFRAASDLALDISRSYMIGNAEIDIETGRRAGCKASLLVSRGTGEANPGRLESVLTFESVLEAARWVTQQVDHRRRGSGTASD